MTEDPLSKALKVLPYASDWEAARAGPNRIDDASGAGGGRAGAASDPVRSDVHSALRRSWWMVLLCVILAVAAIVALNGVEGPQYSASSQDLVQLDVSSLTTGVGSQSGDTSQLRTAADALIARTAAFARNLAASLADPNWQKIQKSVDAVQESGTNLLNFTATASTGAGALRLVDAAARQFPVYLDGLYQSSIAEALAATRGLLQGGSDPILRAELARLRVAQTSNPGVTALGGPSAATKTRPRIAQEAAEGVVVGLVVGLLLMAAREALRPRQLVLRVGEERPRGVNTA